MISMLKTILIVAFIVTYPSIGVTIAAIDECNTYNEIGYYSKDQFRWWLIIVWPLYLLDKLIHKCYNDTIMILETKSISNKH